MSNPDADLEARWRAATDAAIAKVLAERQLPAEASLAETRAPAASAGVERVAREAGQQIEQAIAAARAQASAAELPAWPNCPRCGQKLKNKGKRSRRIVTEAGEVEVERPNYDCATCPQGLFPPG